MIRGKSRPVRQEISIEAAIHNRFDVEVRDSRTGKIRQRAQAYNIICDALWTRMLGGDNAPWFAYILYGKGSGTPAAEDTELFSKLGAVSVQGTYQQGYAGINEVSTIDSANGVYSLRRSNYIDETVAVGETITEIGIGYDDTHAVTHAMLEDMNGNPISITKTATDIITFYATVYVHWSSSGYSNAKIKVVPLPESRGSGNYMASPSLLWCLACGDLGGNARVYPGAGESYGVLSGNAAGSTAYREQSLIKSDSNKSISISGMRFTVNDANGEVRGFTVFINRKYTSSFGLPSLYIDADAFTRTSWGITGEAVGTGDGTSLGFATKFPVRSGATIYVDGVESSAVTIREGVLDTAHPGYYFDGIDSTGRLRPHYPITTGDVPASNSDDDMNFRSKTMYFRNTKLLPIDGYYTNIGGAASNPAVSAVEYSSDFVHWTAVSATRGSGSDWSFAEPVTALYWRVTYNNWVGTYARFYFTNSAGSANNVSFDSAPAAGAVITADYVPDCIPKDSDHVFDLSLTITLGEYTGS